MADKKKRSAAAQPSKKKQARKKPTVKKTRAELRAEEEERARRTSIALRIFAIVSIAAILAIITVGIVSMVINSEKLDFNDRSIKLGKYIKLSPEDYKNYPVELTLEPVDDLAIENALIQALYNSRTTDPDYKGLYNVADTDPIRALAAGDTVRAHYIGYTLGEGGERLYFTSNFNKVLAESDNIGIGEGKLYPGFELGLIGKSPWEYSQLTKIKEGTVKAGDIVSFKMLAIYSDGSTAQLQSYITAMDPASCDAAFGEGFAEFMIGREIGEVDESFTTNTVSDKSGNSVYSDITIEAIYDCGNAPMTVEARVPLNNTDNPDLAGKTVYFDVFVEKVSYGSVPEVDEKFITEKVGLTLEELNGYGKEGDGVIDRYRAYLAEALEALAISEAKDAIVNAFWEQVLDKVEVKRLPMGDVNEYYDDYIADITNYYENNATEDASSLDEYAITYLELEKGDDWRAAVLESAERAVTEKIIFYYIINEEGFWPSDAEYAENYERVVVEMVNSLIAYEGGNPETVSDEEYASWRKLVEDNYGEAYFRENVIYEYAIEKIVAMAKVIYK